MATVKCKKILWQGLHPGPRLAAYSAPRPLAGGTGEVARCPFQELHFPTVCLSGLELRSFGLVVHSRRRRPMIYHDIP